MTITLWFLPLKCAKTILVFFLCLACGSHLSASSLLSFPGLETQNTETGSTPVSDREKVGLRGPVRTCVEENSLPDGNKYSTASEYTPDGKLLSTRVSNPDGSEWLTKYTYQVARGARLQRMEPICPFPRQPSVQRGRPCQWAKPMISNSNPDQRLSSGSKSFARRGRRSVSRRSWFRSMFTKIVLSAAVLSRAPGNAASGGAEITAAGACGGFSCA